jgi:uncharacterized membrane protein
VVLTFLGAYAFIYHDRRVGIVTMIGALSWFIISLKVTLPYYNEFGSFHVDRFKHLGSGPIDAIKNSITNPGYVIAYAFTQVKISYLVKLLGPLGFLSLLNPQTLLIATPTLAANLLSNNGYNYNIQYQYTALITPFIFISAIYGTAWLFKNRLGKAIISVLIIFTSLFAHFYIMNESPLSKKSLSHHFNYKYHERVEILNELIRLIPPDASVSASPHLVTHLTHRERIFEFPNPFELEYWGVNDGSNPPSKDVDYVFISKSSIPPEHRIILDFLVSEGLFMKLYDDSGKTILLTKIYKGSLEERYKLMKLKTDPVFKELALSQKKYAICDNIESGTVKDECFRDVAIATKDLNLCGWKIKTKKLRDECIAGSK